ncbi:MAG: Phenylalanyl-tRNA synthetase beta chain [Candidatus Bipolaricaulis sibiricus]|uniref:Phenylalanine--tRNA ligase beta subunit n=1 Tax=Bipolaricaulis sibiricus TaxID=2501609 RepID=A0A410FSN5_BIPS1|nr:MAG: Phenylalanyl-tRNA synthetase beta chain [Candidatus Bipolaricaulis sibiricus]
MRASLSWLSEYVDLPPVTVEALAERLTLAGLEVEGITALLAEGVIVARVAEVEPHPKADALAVCQVEIGSGTRTVVCGAPNVAAGALVPLALPGARIPGGTVSVVTLRGVRSEGMILSRQELGLEAKSAGIWDLSQELTVGSEFAPLIGFPDTVLDLKITSNRPDLLGIVGIAREISALYQTPLREPDRSFPESDPAAASLTSVHIADPRDCPRYVARIIRGAGSQPSPLAIEARLLKAGMRPLSLVVDVTNYVLLELGHPLHAFDHAQLSEGRIVVRRARPGEKIRTLDGVERDLSPEVLVIADAARPVAVAGVMGGAEPEVGPHTQTVLLEAAAFSPARVRRSARAVGLRTEASLRFERGLSPEMADVASRRCCALLAPHGMVVARGAVDAYPAPTPTRVIALRKQRVAHVLGVEVPSPEVTDGLSRLGLSLRDRGHTWETTVPPFRRDLEREIDLIEEVARLHGYDRIPPVPPHTEPRIGTKDPAESFADRVREVLAALGLTEAYTPGLVAAAEAQVQLRNPLAQGWEGLRPSLLSGLLAALRANLEAQAPGVALFEVGRVFLRRDGEIAEEDRVAVALSGRPPFPLSGKGEYGPSDLKGLFDALIAALRVEGVELGEIDDPRLHPHRRAGIYLRGPCPADRDPSGHGRRTTDPGPRIPVGWLGELAPSLRADLPGQRRVLALELALAPLRAAARPSEHRPIPRSPASKRDLSLLVPERVPEGSVRAAIVAERLVESAFLYDLYKGEGVPTGSVSLTYEVVFRDRERTLSSEEVEGAVQRILASLGPLGAQLRA